LREMDESGAEGGEKEYLLINARNPWAGMGTAQAEFSAYQHRL